MYIHIFSFLFIFFIILSAFFFLRSQGFISTKQNHARRVYALVGIKNIGRIGRLAIGLALITMLSGMAVGYMSYQSSRELLLESLFESNLNLARLMGRHLSLLPGGATDSLRLAEAQSMWNAFEMRYPGSYLCIIRNDGKLSLHTKNPQLRGLDVGSTLISNSGQEGPRTLRELVQASRDYTGLHISHAGEKQVAAFAYNPTLKETIAVHFPAKAVEKKIVQNALPWMGGFGIILGVLLPFSIGILYLAFTASQDALKRSEARYRRLSNLAFEGIVIHDGGKILDANETFARMFGFEPGDTIGLNIFDRATPASRQMIAAKIAAGDESTYEAEGVHKDGSIIPVEIAARNLVEDGRTLRVVAVRDISERIEHQRRLRESEARYQSLFRNAPTPLWQEDFSALKVFIDDLKRQGITDIRSYLENNPQAVMECARLVRVLEVNEAALKLHKATSQEQLLQGLDMIFTDQSYLAFREQLIAIADGSETQEFEAEVKTLDGKTRNIILRWTPMPGHEDSLARVLLSTVDITARKQMEIKLRESEARLELAVTGSHGGEWELVMEPERPKHIPDEIYLSPRLKALLGYEDHEFPNSVRVWHQHILPEDLPKVKAAARRHLLGMAPLHEVQYRMYHRDGSLRWIYTRGRIHRDAQGRPLRWSGIDWDITKRKLAERDAAFYAQAMKSINDAVIITDLQHRIVYVNQAFLDCYGYKHEEELIGQPIQILRSEHTDQALLKQIEATASEGGWHGELINRRKDGSNFYILLSTSVVHDEDGDTIAYMGIATDITERKAMENRLRESEERYRRLVEAAPAAIGIQMDGKIAYMNPAGLRMLGANSLDEIKDMYFAAFIHPKQEPYLFPQIDRLLERKGDLPVEIECRRLNGERFFMEAASIPSTYGGRRAVQFVGHDITARKLAEEETRRHLHELTLLHRVSVPFSEAKSLESICQHILDTLEAELGWQRGSIWLKEESGKKLALFAHSRMSLSNRQFSKELKRVRKLIAHVGEGITGWVAQHGKALRIGDVRSDHRYVAGDPRIRSEMCIPLQVGGETIGVINVESTERDAFDSHDEQLLTTLANETAIAISNVRLVMQLRKELARRMKVELELRSKSDLLSMAMRAANAGVWERNLTTGKITWSEEVFLLFEIEPGSITPSHEKWLELIHPDDRPAVQQAMHDAVANRSALDCEYRIILQNGATRWFNDIGRVVFDAKGNVKRFYGFLIDITHRKLAEEALRRTQDMLLRAEKLARIGSWEWDLQSGKVTWSPEMYRHYQLDAAEMPEPNVEASFIHVNLQDQQRLRENTERSLATGIVEPIEYRLDLPGGRRRILQRQGEMICDSSGKPNRMVGFVQDITERKEAEEQLLRYQERLRELAAELSRVEERERRIIAEELHDHIGQALAVCKLKLHELEKHLNGGSHRESLSQAIDLISQSIQSTRSLIFELSPPLLHQLGLPSALEWLAEQFESKYGLHVQVRCPVTLPELEEDMRVFLFKAVRELLINIVKHAGATQATVSLLESDDVLEVTIADNGVGFTEQSGQVRMQASGFGLFNIRERITHYGGEFDLSSSRKSGTQVRLRLPITLTKALVNGVT